MVSFHGRHPRIAHPPFSLKIVNCTVCTEHWRFPDQNWRSLFRILFSLGVKFVQVERYYKICLSTKLRNRIFNNNPLPVSTISKTVEYLSVKSFYYWRNKKNMPLLKKYKYSTSGGQLLDKSSIFPTKDSIQWTIRDCLIRWIWLLLTW